MKSVYCPTGEACTAVAWDDQRILLRVVAARYERVEQYGERPQASDYWYAVHENAVRCRVSKDQYDALRLELADA